MSTFAEVIEFEVPAMQDLQEKLKASAQIFNKGKKIQVGAHKAVKKGIWTEFFNNSVTYHVTPPSDIPPLVYVFRSTKIETSITDIIEIMATLEARRTLPCEDRKAALKNALLEKLKTLEIS